MDFFQAQAKVLALMGITDAGPVLSNEDALKIADRARRAADSAAGRARK